MLIMNFNFQMNLIEKSKSTNFEGISDLSIFPKHSLRYKN